MWLDNSYYIYLCRFVKISRYLRLVQLADALKLYFEVSKWKVTFSLHRVCRLSCFYFAYLQSRFFLKDPSYHDLLSSGWANWGSSTQKLHTEKSLNDINSEIKDEINGHASAISLCFKTNERGSRDMQATWQKKRPTWTTSKNLSSLNLKENKEEKGKNMV